MANTALIQGEAKMRGGESGSGFVDYSASMRPTKIGRSETNAKKAEEKAKATNAINAANSYMSKLKSDFDFTGLDDDAQKAMREFLILERSKYAEAASAISKIQDHTSPEYQYYVDQMNSVQQGFVNLSEQVKAYKENKLQYGELTKSSQWSLGAGDEISHANTVFGIGDQKAKLTVLPGGKLGYDAGNGIQMFDNFEMPTMKAYDTANGIMKLANDYYNKGVAINPYAESVISSSVDKMLADPTQLKSLVSGDFDTDGLSFGDIEWSDDIEGIRQQVKDRVIQGVRSAAAAGKAYKDSKTSGNNSNTTTDPQTGKPVFKYDTSIADLKAFPGMPVTMRGLDFVYDPNTGKYSTKYGDRKFEFTEEKLKEYLTR